MRPIISVSQVPTRWGSTRRIVRQQRDIDIFDAIQETLSGQVLLISCAVFSILYCSEAMCYLYANDNYGDIYVKIVTESTLRQYADGFVHTIYRSCQFVAWML